MKNFKTLPRCLKVVIISLIILIILCLVFIFLPTNIAVLGYHDFTNDVSSNDMQVTASKFDSEMQYLSNHHYQSLKLKDIDCYLNHTCKLSKKSVLITMDDGWKNELLIAAPILKKYNLNAVIFYIGSNYDGHNSNFMDANDLKTLTNDYPNIEIASHSYDLHHENDYLKSYDDLNNDFKNMESIIDSKYFAYPYGFYNSNYEQVLKDNNYQLAFTFGPGKLHRKIKSNDNIYEVPRLNISNSMSLTKFELRLLLPF